VTTLQARDPSWPDHDPSSTAIVGLLRIGMTGAHRPVDRLLDRLTLADGHRWFGWAIAGESSDPDSPWADIARITVGSIELDSCARIKDLGKQILARSRASDIEHLRGTLLYMIGIAGALAWHRRLISTQSRDTIEPVLMDLSEAAPGEWRAFFAKAGDACASLAT